MKAIIEFLQKEDLGWISMSGAEFTLIAFLIGSIIVIEGVDRIRGGKGVFF